uniref:Trichoplein keratin filament-binding protein n=1 Tax=Glossina austeni TaxID=7395 RepID=A0A1A9VNP2_GLOAU
MKCIEFLLRVFFVISLIWCPLHLINGYISKLYVLPVAEEMSKAAQLQALYARRRQAEDDRIERTQELNRYYDHWGKVTTRFANWTAPEYYDKAGQQLQETKDKKEKEKGLAVRQRKLSEIFTTERETFDREMNELKRVRSRKVPTDTLEKIDENLKNQDKIRRKLELEAKLYGKLRHGVDDENLVFDSKSENETLAKLNWLDKQVNTQLEREREEARKQDQKLRLQEKQIKLEQLQKERHAIREREIQEVRTIQENYMLQLKERQEESENLKSEEKKLRDNIDELGKELELLKETDVVMQKPADLTQAYNFKRIKTFIRKRSEEFRNHIKIHIAILERTLDYAKKVTIADELIQKYKKLLDFEAQYVSQIEAMYESEAKSSLLRSEENWTRQHRERCNEINQYLENERKAFKVQLNDNLQRQEDVIELRSACLALIEDVSEKLKQLIKEEEESPRGNENTQESLTVSSSEAKKVRFEPNAKTSVSPSSLPQITKSFNNLNLDVWQDLPSSRRGIDTLPTNNNPNIVTPENVERPKYGRKRVAWT